MNLQGPDLYLSFWEYAEPNGRLNVDYDIGGMVAPQQTDAMIRFQVGCGGHDGREQVADIPYWWNALTGDPILYVEGVWDPLAQLRDLGLGWELPGAGMLSTALRAMATGRSGRSTSEQYADKRFGSCRWRSAGTRLAS
jgi:hypothetical protein